MKTAQQFRQINSTNYWFKIVEFLQTNWALIEEATNGQVKVSFIDDTSAVFDEMTFTSLEQTVEELMDNGFDLYSEAPHVHQFLKPPLPPFILVSHINGPIYSSGRFWKSAEQTA